MHSPPPTVVVLAAGRGCRFRGPGHKLQEPFNGSTVLGSTVQHALASGLPVLLVTTRPLAAQARRWLPGADIVVLDDEQAARGVGRSIAAGVAERGASRGWLILPGDMPLVRPATLRAVAQALGEQPVVFAQHHGRRGHPVAFAGELYSELAVLSGDEGARRIVARYPSLGLEVDDPGVLLDIDTVDDLEGLRRQLHAVGDDATA